MRVPIVFWVSEELRDEVNASFDLSEKRDVRKCDEFLERVLREAVKTVKQKEEGKNND